MWACPTNFGDVPRLCERPGCSAPATVTYGFDTAELLVWLSPFEPEEKARPYGSGILCRRHADALVVPRGWHVDDRREVVPRLFIAPPVEERPASGVAKSATKSEGHGKVRSIREKQAPLADLFDAVAVAGSEAEPQLDETRAMPWSPKLIEELSDDNAGLGADEPPKGGLLARAFGNKDRRERS